MVTIELDEILDQLYIKIQQFLITNVGEDLDQDLIDISLETTEDGELIVNIDLYLELSPFSNYDVQKVAEDAVKYGIKEADQICPSYIINIRG
ncbi:MAG: DUF3194 domain-containing protein [Candidatus Heimdallarchaeota archaeon]|nr:MAG: DUF3194 domain-containing protein [Candidatus Heimdallarchaeota archaeon]